MIDVNGSDFFPISDGGIEVNPDEPLTFDYSIKSYSFENLLSSTDFNGTGDGLNYNPGLTNEQIVHAVCHYWDRSTLWYFFLAFNFSVMFILPLIVSFAFLDFVTMQLISYYIFCEPLYSVFALVIFLCATFSQH